MIIMKRLSIEELKEMDLMQLDLLLDEARNSNEDSSYIQDIEVVISDKLDEY